MKHKRMFVDDNFIGGKTMEEELVKTGQNLATIENTKAMERLEIQQKRNNDIQEKQIYSQERKNNIDMWELRLKFLLFIIFILLLIWALKEHIPSDIIKAIDGVWRIKG